MPEADLLEIALAHSPLVEAGEPGLAYLDVAGLRRLWGDEGEIGRRLVRAAADRGFQIRVGIAGSRIAALVAARRADDVTVVEPGADAQYLARAPLSLLDLSAEMTARLGTWGLRTLGELAALPAAALFERLGSEGLRLHRFARGEDARPLQPWVPPAVFEETIEPGWAVETLEPLGELMASLVERICDRLARRGLVADQFQWTCRLTDRTVHNGSFTPAVAMSEPATIIPLLRASLESQPPRGAVEAIALRARPARATPAQESLMERARPNPRMISATLVRLAALLGARQLGTAVLLDSHRPDAVAIESYLHSPRSSAGPEERQREGESSRAVLALRRFRPACSAHVTLSAGRPVHVRSDRLTSRIVASVGPWRASGEWWTAHPWIHDEWDVELGDGILCRLAHDGAAWWLEGIYD
jgi:protein ImuB